MNAAQDSTDLVAKLRAFHNEAQVNPERKNLKWWASSLLKKKYIYIKKLEEQKDKVVGQRVNFSFCCRIGLDLVNGKPRDNRQAGVYEPITVKTKSLKFATEAAITILRIDDLIKLFPEQKEDGQSYRDAVQSGSLEG